MSFEGPRLDDRSYRDILEEALRRIPHHTKEWTDYNPSDPGITIIELFAWMTDLILYRLNRVPDKHYIKLMELLGMRLQESQPAQTDVTFWLSAPQPESVTIPEGTVVSTTRTDIDPAILFTTNRSATIVVPKMHTIAKSNLYDDQQLTFGQVIDIKRLNIQHDPYTIFNEPDDEDSPLIPDDAFYVGFSNDVGQHVLVLNITIEVPGNEGVDPDIPPYMWEMLSREDDNPWVECEIIEDGTEAFKKSGLVALKLPPARRYPLDTVDGYWLRCRLDSKEGKALMPTSRPEISGFVVQSWGITIPASNVSIANKEVLGRSDGSPGQRFYLTHTPVIKRYADGSEDLVVFHEGASSEDEGELWQEVHDFADSQKQDRHYTLNSQTGEVRLPPAIRQYDGEVKSYGSVPPKGAMLVMQRYRYGGGLQGNVAAESINVLKSSIPYIDRVSNSSPARGGRDAETLDAMKLRVPQYLRSLGRAVTPADYEYLAQNAGVGRIGRVYCQQGNNGDLSPGEVRLLVIPEVPNNQGFITWESLQMPDTLRSELQMYLDERRLLSTKLDIRQPDYHWVMAKVELRAKRGWNTERVKMGARNRIFEYLNPLIGGEGGGGWSFGRHLGAADLMVVLSYVPGVDAILKVEFFPHEYTIEDGYTSTLGKNQDGLTTIEVSSDGVIASYGHMVNVI